MGRIIFATILLALLSAGINAQENKPSGIAGDWSGVLDVGAARLTLVLHIAQDVAGALSAKLDSPDQGASDIPVDTITFADRTLKFEMKRLGAAYEGALNNEGSEISGQFTQGGVSFLLILKRGVIRKEPPKRPQEPKPPYPYHEEEVSYDNKAAEGVKLAGTLTLPKTQGPFPAVLLISGSGPQDRNETLLGHKPFLVLADHLTRQGIAVLRVDDRGVAKSTGKFATATSEDFASDALAGIEYLKSRREINPREIGLIGHSEGGMIAPLVAAKSKDVAFIILMAGPGVTGEEILYEQAALMSRAAGAGDEAIAKNRRVQEQMFAVVKTEKDSAAAEKKLKEVMSAQMAQLSDEERKLAAGSAAAAEAQIKQVNSPWFRYFLTYDPRAALRQVKAPVLAINGELDLQVSPRQNLPEIEKALKAAGNSDYKIIELSKLNHLFQTAQTGAFAEYEKIEETMSPTALNTISDWILKRTATKK
jgi:pimeloyl-ACP methyl ester carboxylesterase